MSSFEVLQGTDTSLLAPGPHPSHLELGPAHLGVSAVPGDGETQFPMQNEHKGPGGRGLHPHLLDQEATAFGFPQRCLILASHTTALVFFQMEGALPFG